MTTEPTTTDVEAVADLVGSRAGFQPPTMVARAILASDWLAAYVAAERDRAVSEALASVRALAEVWEREGWTYHDARRITLRSNAAALHAALPAEPEGTA